MSEVIRVLHIEDDPDYLATVKDILDLRWKGRLEVVEFASGILEARDKIAKLEEFAVGVIFLDNFLKGIEAGTALLRLIRRVSNEVVVVGASSDKFPDQVDLDLYSYRGSFDEAMLKVIEIARSRGF